MEISFTPSPDVTVVLTALLDILERRTQHIIPKQSGVDATRNKDHTTRAIKVPLTDLPLPAYFSQTDPAPRIIANEQLTQLEQAGLLTLTWLPGEKGHLLQSTSLKTEYAPLYALLNRKSSSSTRSHLESLLLADKFRFSGNDWRARAIHRTMTQLRAGKSSAPFSLTDSTWNLDLLTVLSALPSLAAETPYRVFSVRTFNDSKRFHDLKPAIVRLARRANPEWKTLSAEDLLRELNLVANPSYIYMAGNWQLTTQSGEILSLGSFTPSVGFPAAHIETIQTVSIHAEHVICIENLTSFHEFLRAQETTQRNISSCSKANRTPHATICLMGNPSPAIRRLLQLIPETTPIHLWSDMDYGGFNILSQLRRFAIARIQPYLMDISTFIQYAHLSRPLTQMDVRNLKNLRNRLELADIKPTIEHLLQCGLKLEQEAIQV